MDENKNCFIACGEETVNNGHCDCDNRISNELAEELNIIPLSLNLECVNCNSKNRLKGTMGSSYCGDCGRYWH